MVKLSFNCQREEPVCHPELAAGIRRVKGVKQLGSRLGNWLSTDQAKLHYSRPYLS
jgi:hypothetical protein